MPKNISRLATAIRRRRRALSLTQQELGDLAGCGRLFIHQVEKAKITVRLDKLLDIMAILGLQFRLENGTQVLVDGIHETN
ncbi:MAG: helix-turn-helix domain-containing protein [Planctomycetota bacterium]